EVAVRDNDEVERHAPERLEIGRGGPADFFGMQAAVHQKVQVAELDEQRIGADAAIAVQVCQFHVAPRQTRTGARTRTKLRKYVGRPMLDITRPRIWDDQL